MDRDKAIFFGVIGTVVVLLVVYISLSFGKDSSKAQREETFETPDLEIENKKYDYNSRIAALTQNRYEDDKRENTLRYNFTQQEIEQNAKQETPQKTVAETQKELPKRKKEDTPGKTHVPSTNKPKTTSDNEPIAESSVSVSYSFSSASGQTQAESTKAISNQKIVWAQLDEKISVQNNSHQVFLLEKGSYIGGRYFPGNSKLYTKAVTENYYIDIQVYRIKDINSGEEFSISLYAINEDRDRGIKYQGRENKEGDRTRNNVLSETMKSVSRRYDISEVGQAIGEGVEDISGRDKIEVPLAKGYRLIFVEN